MSYFSRLTDIVTCNLSEILAKESDPATALKRIVAEMEEGLLTKRNTAWLPVILDALKGRDQITVAAGAGHLNGPSGLLALFEAEGFALERLPF